MIVLHEDTSLYAMQSWLMHKQVQQLSRLCMQLSCTTVLAKMTACRAGAQACDKEHDVRDAPRGQLHTCERQLRTVHPESCRCRPQCR